MAKVPRMANKITIDKNLCIGCGTCTVIASKTFKLGNDGKAEVINPPADKEEKISKLVSAEIKEAIDSCPVGAIKVIE